MISVAYAQGAGAAPAGGGLLGLLPFLAIFGVMYFLMIRPQMKRAKEQREMIEALKKGDEVVTSGGIAGRVTKVGEQYVSLEVAKSAGRDGSTPIEMHFQKGAVQTLLPSGTIKSL